MFNHFIKNHFYLSNDFGMRIYCKRLLDFWQAKEFFTKNKKFLEEAKVN